MDKVVRTLGIILFKEFEVMAQYLEEEYGMQYDRDEQFVICPECGEPIYKCDWEMEEYNRITDEDELIMFCPICEYEF